MNDHKVIHVFLGDKKVGTLEKRVFLPKGYDPFGGFLACLQTASLTDGGGCWWIACC
ncbi:MAG: hypothetical protein NC420_12760 [Eubacterium sp.]|nr:hypothetical protein [Eubacterium sp.]